jgi:hypothetical protein
MAIWYVRPNTSHSGTRNGTSYATAWGGWSEIVWGVSGVNAGDTLYLCGAHAYTASIALGAHGATSDSNRVTIRGDYATSPGSIAFSTAGWFDFGRKYTTLKSVTITSTSSGFNCIYISGSATAGVVIDGCTLTGADNGVVLAGSTAFTSLTIKNCNISGQTNSAINQTSATASLTSSGIVITGNTIHDTSLYGIYMVINSPAWDTSYFNDYYIANNTIYNLPGGPMHLRVCNSDTTTAPVNYSSGLVISGNTIYNCGTVAGASGTHGTPNIEGFIGAVIVNNTVRDCYAEGAGLQTWKNKNPLIAFNTILRIRSATRTDGFQNGLPIDGNGIFFDVLTVGGLAYGNYISDLISTGNTNSGTALSFWNCTGSRFIGNVVENCYVGASYGHTNETGNEIYNNTFINCTKGVDKVGTLTLTGNLTVKNNIFSGCTNGFTIGANPGITADYNCIHGATTAYTGISAGANDLAVNPLLDTKYRTQSPTLKRSGTAITGKDFYGKVFYSTPTIGAVEDHRTPAWAAVGQVT